MPRNNRDLEEFEEAKEHKALSEKQILGSDETNENLVALVSSLVSDNVEVYSFIKEVRRTLSKSHNIINDFRLLLQREYDISLSPSNDSIEAIVEEFKTYLAKMLGEVYNISNLYNNKKQTEEAYINNILSLLNDSCFDNVLELLQQWHSNIASNDSHDQYQINTLDHNTTGRKLHTSNTRYLNINIESDESDQEHDESESSLAFTRKNEIASADGVFTSIDKVPSFVFAILSKGNPVMSKELNNKLLNGQITITSIEIESFLQEIVEILSESLDDLDLTNVNVLDQWTTICDTLLHRTNNEQLSVELRKIPHLFIYSQSENSIVINPLVTKCINDIEEAKKNQNNQNTNKGLFSRIFSKR